MINLMKNFSIFGGSAATCYLGCKVIGKEGIVKFVSEMRRSGSGFKLDDDPKSENYAKDHVSELKQFLTLSKIQFNETDKTVKYYYLPTVDSQGFPGVCHGGFSYSVCLNVAEEYAKHFGIKKPILKTFMRYYAPIHTENYYVIQGREEDGQIKLDVMDENQKKYSTLLVTFSDSK